MLEAWFYIAAGLLVISGGSKLIDPDPTMGALRSASLPSARPWVYALGIGEVVAAFAGIVFGGWAALTVASLYGGFAAFVAYALARKIPIASCGCFGRPDTPPTGGHLVFNLVSTLVAVLVAAGGIVPIDTLGGQPLGSAAYLAFVALGVSVVYLLLTELPMVLAAR